MPNNGDNFPGNGWTQYSKLVLAELVRLSESIKEVGERIDDLKATFNEAQSKTKVDIALLQFKAGIWGLLAGAIPSAVVVFIEATKGR